MSAQGCRACEATLGFQACSANPERVSRRVRIAPSGFLQKGMHSNRRSTLGTWAKIASQPYQRLNRIRKVSAYTARTIQSFQDGEAIITQTPEELLRLGHLP